MPMKLDIKKDILIPAATDPNDREFHWAINPAYTSTRGPGMIMTVVKRISSGGDHWRQRTSALQRMRSSDGGVSWTKDGPEISSKSYESGDQVLAWSYFLDLDKQRLLSIHQLTKPNPAGGVPFTILHYEISADGGKTWGPSRQIIHQGSEFDERHWMPGIGEAREQYIGVDQIKFAKLDDGTIVFGFDLSRPASLFLKEVLYSVVFMRGHWNDAANDLTWDAGDVIRNPMEASPYGVAEPDLIHLGGQRLLTTMRTQGNLEPLGIFTTRQWSLSEDGGRTWSPPRTLCYEDGSMVCVPASITAFERDPATGTIYWFGNILDHPVTEQSPRYPLTMAELDPERICIIKDSVTIIQDLPPGAPANRSYSNFGHYVDRVTGEFVLMVAEKPKVNDLDFRSDTLRFRIHVNRT